MAQEKEQNPKSEKPEKAPNINDNHDISDPLADFSETLDAYQKRLESQWESTKSVYQQRINEVMNDFIDKNLIQIPDQSAPQKNPRSSPDFDEPGDEVLKRILAKTEKALKKSDESLKTFQSSNQKNPDVINISWGSRKSFWNKIFTVGGGLLFSIALLCGGYYFFQIPNAVTSLPYDHSSNLTLGHGHLYNVDWLRKAIYVHDLKWKFPISSIEYLPLNYIAGVSFTDTDIWSIDGLSLQINKHAISRDHTIVKQFPSPAEKPTAIFHDGTNFWIIEGGARRYLYKLHGQDPTEVRDKFSFADKEINHIVVRDHRLWALSFRDRDLTEYRIQEPLKPLHTYDLDNFLKGSNPTGFCFYKNHVIFSTENPGQLLAVPLSKLNSSKIDN